ncbi:MAG TPA: hypothetical protein VMM92_00575 [Thermoanaerobaculia bacterium]|nr:hypothetical protein [Thermoanaerobaculia bacterium]
MAVVLAILVVVPDRASAQAQTGALRIAMWLGSVLAGYPIGKAIDQVVDAATARDNEEELTSIQLNLQNLYKKSLAKPKEAAQLKRDLGTTTSELKILQSLRRQAPTREDLSRFRAEIGRDITALKSTLARHEKLLEQHGRELQQQDERLRKQEGEIAELQQRLDQQQAPPPPPPGPPVSLTIVVEGTSDVIRLHTDRWCELSDNTVATGIVHVSKPEITVDYCLARGTAAVVELGAQSAWVSMPESLSDLVEIHDNGWRFQRWVYPDP